MALPSTNTSRYGDLPRRLIFLLLALLVYRIGTHIPVPGIDINELKRLVSSTQDGLLGLFNLFSGGALSRFSIMTLGIVPYISASIVMQLLSYTVPALEAIKKEGASGQRLITQYTRYGTLGLVIFQSVGVAIAVESANMALNPGFGFRLTTVVSLTAGSMFLMWLGEQITERGLGNGISLLIFAGIVSGLPFAIAGFLDLIRNNAVSIFAGIIILAMVLFATYFVVFVERAQRKVLLTYAKRQVGNKVYGGQSWHLPLKLNMSGVIPPIFASSIMVLPATLISFSSAGGGPLWLRDISALLTPGSPIYIVLFATMIIFFAYFYTALVFNSKETAENLKRSGAFIPGIRPGEQTAKYIDRVILRLTFFGALYLTAVSLLPEFLRAEFNVSFFFGGTSLLIIVVVAMDFMAQVQASVTSQQYEALLKKSNFKNNPLLTR